MYIHAGVKAVRKNKVDILVIPYCCVKNHYENKRIFKSRNHGKLL